MAQTGGVIRSGDIEYTIKKLLGEGASTKAYLAECRRGELSGLCILKEFSPRDDADNADRERLKARFIASAKLQNKLRQLSVLNNQTPPVSRIFEANDTVYIDVVCYNGDTLDKISGLKLSEYMLICEAAAKTVGYYHREGYICLDIKPENIFVMQNAPGDTITRLVEFIDFDSVRRIGGDGELSYTRSWAAPEQLSVYGSKRLGKAADIYAVGEMAFFILFGRHSMQTEHRGFSKYPFEQAKPEYRKFTERTEIRALFTRLFRNTLRSSAVNRFETIDQAAELLRQIANELERKDYIIPTLPAVSPLVVGREAELSRLGEMLKTDRVVFIAGVGGIGKSTLLKSYIRRSRSDYDAIIYLEFDGDIAHTLCDDLQLQISTLRRSEEESAQEYFAKKLTGLKRIAAGRRTLFVLDNFYGKITKELSQIIESGFETIIATRNMPPKNSFAVLQLGAIAEKAELFKLIANELERQPSREERLCFEEIISLVQGHTLVITLIARQAAAGGMEISAALEAIRECGFSHFSMERIGNYKDGEEVYDTLCAIISILFDSSGMSKAQRLAMKAFALLDVRGLETKLIEKLYPEISKETITDLARLGWLSDGERVYLHPVIAEAVRDWDWQTDDASVMENYKRAAAIYSGMANEAQLRLLLRYAKEQTENCGGHMAKAIYLDILAELYDTMLGGNYVPYNDSEAELIEKLAAAMSEAIREAELSEDKTAQRKYLPQLYLSMANILIRSLPQYHRQIKGLLYKADRLTAERICPDRCYYYMVKAWYHTLVKTDFKKTKKYAAAAKDIAEKVFHSDLELCDIIYIPTANCFFYHNELSAAAEELETAVSLCESYSDILPYIDKKAELLNCLTDVYLEMGDVEKCRELVGQIDDINEKYRDDGICREVSDEIREILK